MTDFEFTAKTVEEAVEEGLKATGLTREQAEITVLEEGKRKLIGSVKAKVLIRKKKSDGERAADFLDGVFDILKIAATNELVEEDETIKINVIATNTDSIIGHRGRSSIRCRCLRAPLRISAERNTGASSWIAKIIANAGKRRSNASPRRSRERP